MAQENKQQPRNIFEAINQNIVFLSQDIVQLYEIMENTQAMVKGIHAALYPPQENAGPTAPGTEQETE